MFVSFRVKYSTHIQSQSRFNSYVFSAPSFQPICLIPEVGQPGREGERLLCDVP